MTPYPVQCFDNNGEPYGRFINPHKKNAIEWPYFEIYAEDNTLPMPGAEIGKRYERDEVEVGYQSRLINGYLSLTYNDCSFEQYKTSYRALGSDIVKKIFRLISKTETIPQPVEKEPETVEQFYETWCKANKKNGSFLFRSSVIELMTEWQKQQSKND